MFKAIQVILQSFVLALLTMPFWPILGVAYVHSAVQGNRRRGEKFKL